MLDLHLCQDGGDISLSLSSVGLMIVLMDRNTLAGRVNWMAVWENGAIRVQIKQKNNKDTQHTDSTALQNDENYGVFKRMLKLK